MFHQTQQNLAAQKGGYKSCRRQKKSSGQGEIFNSMHARWALARIGISNNSRSCAIKSASIMPAATVLEGTSKLLMVFCLGSLLKVGPMAWKSSGNFVIGGSKHLHRILPPPRRQAKPHLERCGNHYSKSSRAVPSLRTYNVPFNQRPHHPGKLLELELLFLAVFLSRKGGKFIALPAAHPHVAFLAGQSHRPVNSNSILSRAYYGWPGGRKGGMGGHSFSSHLPFAVIIQFFAVIIHQSKCWDFWEGSCF